jgi:hypothetical protein
VPVLPHPAKSVLARWIDTGYLKVPYFAGLLRLGVERSIDAAVSEFSWCYRLIFDLRGHLGGGLGVLRLMSHLTAERIPG